MLFSIAKRVNLTKLKCCSTKGKNKRIFYYRKLLTLKQCSFNVNIILLYDLAHRIFVKQNHQFPFGQRRRRFAKGEPVNARLRSLSLAFSFPWPPIGRSDNSCNERPERKAKSWAATAPFFRDRELGCYRGRSAQCGLCKTNEKLRCR